MAIATPWMGVMGPVKFGNRIRIIRSRRYHRPFLVVSASGLSAQRLAPASAQCQKINPRSAKYNRLQMDCLSIINKINNLAGGHLCIFMADGGITAQSSMGSSPRPRSGKLSLAICHMSVMSPTGCRNTESHKGSTDMKCWRILNGDRASDGQLS